jgi:hypothetical protein
MIRYSLAQSLISQGGSMSSPLSGIPPQFIFPTPTPPNNPAGEFSDEIVIDNPDSASDIFIDPDADAEAAAKAPQSPTAIEWTVVPTVVVTVAGAPLPPVPPPFPGSEEAVDSSKTLPPPPSKNCVELFFESIAQFFNEAVPRFFIDLWERLRECLGCEKEI